MNYQDVIEILEENKINLTKVLANNNLPKEEYEMIQQTIDNYNYIIELTEMNHFERGFVH